MRGPKRTVEVLTGEILPVSFKDMETRVNFIRNRSKQPPKSTLDHDFSVLNRTEEVIGGRETSTELETDQLSTNFNPKRPEIAFRTTTKSFSRSGKPPQVYPVQQAVLETEKRRPLTSYKRAVRVSKTTLTESKKQEGKEAEGRLQGQAHFLVFQKEMGEFQNLYQHMAAILGCINQGGLQAVEQAIRQYVEYIQSKKLSFIDDFIEGRERQLQKLVRQSRLNESLSIAYLFLELAQNRIQNHQSYLTNFLGYCLSNVLLVARLYALKEGRREFPQSPFEVNMREVQIGSFGNALTSFKDVLLRLQHNNEIIAMMHRKLGRFNPKFETCIQLFFKTAERKRTSCVQCTYYIFEYLALHIHEAELTGISKTLQMAPTPYCPPPIKPYTLILEPLGILLSEGRTRPYLFQFVEWASKYFDIVLWTWEMPYEPQIQKLYAKLDDYVVSKLYRYHCIEENQIWVKDLNRLGRSLERTLIVDYDKRIFCRHPKNGIELRWRFGGPGKDKDKGLLFLCQILQEMVTSDSIVEDMVTIYAQQLFNIRGY